jgi:hypothetical protein
MRRSCRTAHRLLLGVIAAWLLASGAIPGAQVEAPTGFASRIAQLSEAGGYFDADNLISNERSYLQVMAALGDARLAGGAYIGVGPDQNFSYIAQLKPSIAFIVDIRRDNMLLHLLFKALFHLSSTRVEYLSLLCGRPVPPDLDAWRNADVERLTAFVAGARPSPDAVAELRRRVDATIRSFGVPLSAGDYSTIDRFHRTFIDSGLDLKFRTFTYGVRSHFPTYRDLIVERDHEGRQSSYLASEERFQFVRALEQRDLVIPVVGNFVGSHALAAIGRLMKERGVPLSAFYVSNVEFYLFSDGTFARFVDNLSHIPRTDRSLIIRSVFAGGVPSLMPQAVPGYPSASIVHSLSELLEGYANGRFHVYRELTTVSAPRTGEPVR